jgi:hypothetical protein
MAFTFMIIFITHTFIITLAVSVNRDTVLRKRNP